MTELEDPAALLGRLKVGREEFCQRLLTSLIIDGPYPRWNTPSAPSLSGIRFLQAVDELSFGHCTWTDPPVFVDEFELPKRHDAERGGAPDYAVGWPARLWMIELKTEAASHRPDQIPSYFELGRHHRPTCDIDITYLTPPLTKTVVVPDWGRYAHVTWADVAPIIGELWGSSDDPSHRRVAAALLETIEKMDERPAEWRTRWTDLAADVSRAAPVPATPEPVTADAAGASVPSGGDPLSEALLLAHATADDGRQRALDHRASDLESLLALRVEVREAICSSPAGSSVRQVMPWLWRWASTGAPLTEAGQETGYELRFSKYEKELC